MTVCIHAFVSGRVQGVYFRDHTRKRAQALQLTGWVRNTPDGRVEVYACGAQPQIHELIEWLWQGSPASKVSQVDWNEAPFETHTDFIIRYD